MNNVTQSDLSYNEAKVDFQALVTTAAIAVREVRQQISRLDSQLQEDLFSNDVTGIHLKSQWIAEYAQSLAKVADTYSVLLGAKTRDNLTIVNK